MLSEIIEAVMADLNVGRAKPLETLVGERNVHPNGVPPRLVWVPTRDAFGPPEKSAANPRAAYSVTTEVDVHIWGETLAETETLRNSLAWTIRKLFHGSCEVRAGDWITEGELMQRGVVDVLTVAFRGAVTEPPIQTTKIETTELTAEAVPQEAP